MVYVAAHYTTSHHIALISSTSPIWTMLLAGILGMEKLSPYKVFGAASAFLGALIVITHGELANISSISWNYGDVLLLIASVVWSVYCVMMYCKPIGINSKSLMLVIIVIGTLFLLPFYVWEILTVAPAPFTLKAISAYVYLGIGSSIIAGFAWNYSIHTIGSVKTGLVYYTMPIFTGVLAVVILGEPMALYHLVGFMLVFLGIIISNFTTSGIRNLRACW
jgi:drug/metabolite transporter (DMT)-like permease